MNNWTLRHEYAVTRRMGTRVVPDPGHLPGLSSRTASSPGVRTDIGQRGQVVVRSGFRSCNSDAVQRGEVTVEDCRRDVIAGSQPGQDVHLVDAIGHRHRLHPPLDGVTVDHQRLGLHIDSFDRTVKRVFPPSALLPVQGGRAPPARTSECPTSAVRRFASMPTTDTVSRATSLPVNEYSAEVVGFLPRGRRHSCLTLCCSPMTLRVLRVLAIARHERQRVIRDRRFACAAVSFLVPLAWSIGAGMVDAGRLMRAIGTGARAERERWLNQGDTRPSLAGDRGTHWSSRRLRASWRWWRWHQRSRQRDARRLSIRRWPCAPISVRAGARDVAPA
jgi:hypothetical protein